MFVVGSIRSGNQEEIVTTYCMILSNKRKHF